MENKVFAVIVALIVILGLGSCAGSCSSFSPKSSNNTTTSQQSSNSTSSGSSSSSKYSSEYSGSSSSSSSNGGYHSDAISWKDAKKYIGKHMTVKGEIKSVRTQETKGGTATFINIGADYPDSSRITAVVWPENRQYFSEYSEWALSPSAAGKTVYVSGTLENYKGVVQIRINGGWEISQF